MAAPVDLELKKAFTELQAKVIDTQQKVKLADIQIEQLNRTKKHAHLTDTEIMTLVDETNMYEGVGRMFILQSKEVIHSQLLEKQKIAEEKIKELEVGHAVIASGSSTFSLKYPLYSSICISWLATSLPLSVTWYHPFYQP
ncbi:prefoldin subunit 1 isoform X1 [Talpa occidentalis]|uniref:prefoldin subunit 1 isoform X1 n=1 Tax=Talpa occidentalis TaxID=50954 RepID=UPI0023F7964B|nr:prefoldin subunit 1 isoform X1 [Talpa occidentalis]XP_054550297.1 prefoldin subunit 1 isoform X1 [Talpa occidentalis]